MASSVDIPKLCAAIQRSRLVLRWPRQQRFELARECAGDHYSQGGAQKPVKVNLLALYQSIMGNILVANEPRFILTTADSDSRAQVRIEQDWLNEQVTRMGLGQTLRAGVVDALYATGIFKVALSTPCDAARLAWGITAGEPICTTIDLDDFVYDIAAKTFDQATYIGHRYRCPIDVAKKMYGRKAKNLSAENEDLYNRDGDMRIGQLLRGTYQPEEFEEHVELWEIWCPRHRKIITLSDQDVVEQGKDGRSQALWEQDWIGPDWGPFIFAGFGKVPGSALAKSPMMDLLEPHLDCNNAHRKANNQLRRMKELTVYRRQNDQDAEAIKNANDGDLVPVEQPDLVKSIVTAGSAIQGLLTAAETYQNKFDFIGGNLSLMGGRGPQSKTAAQDKMLNANAGGTVEAMHAQVDAAVSLIGESLLWYAHHHPQLVMESEYRPQGSKGINRKLYPPPTKDSPQPEPHRGHKFHRTTVRLDPYSIRHKSPEERLAFVNSTVQALAPLMPLAQQQGVALDMTKLVSLLSTYGDAPELQDIFTVASPPDQAGGQGGQDAGAGHGKTLPTQTDRTYTRQNIPSAQGPGQALGEMPKEAFGAKA